MSDPAGPKDRALLGGVRRDWSLQLLQLFLDCLVLRGRAGGLDAGSTKVSVGELTRCVTRGRSKKWSAFAFRSCHMRKAERSSVAIRASETTSTRAELLPRSAFRTSAMTASTSIPARSANGSAKPGIAKPCSRRSHSMSAAFGVVCCEVSSVRLNSWRPRSRRC